jgi:hypothetical protein
MKASESGLREVKRAGKMGGLRKNAGWSGFSDLARIS